MKVNKQYTAYFYLANAFLIKDCLDIQAFNWFALGVFEWIRLFWQASSSLAPAISATIRPECNVLQTVSNDKHTGSLEIEL